MKAQKNHDNPWKSYNNEPLREGEVLVPQLVDAKADKLTREFLFK